jgi:hypothetical protein
MDVTNLSPAQLRKAAELKERIDSLTSELGRLLGGEIPVPFVKAAGGSSGGGRRMSAAGRARIAAAARARWARVRAGKGQTSSGSSSPARGKRTMSAAARAKIAAAARARWAKAKAAGKAHL